MSDRLKSFLKTNYLLEKSGETNIQAITIQLRQKITFRIIRQPSTTKEHTRKEEVHIWQDRITVLRA